MKIREEIFNHRNWWQTKFAISDLNETKDEFMARVAYLNYIEPNQRAMHENYYENEQLDYETIDEYRARIIHYYKSIDMGVNEKVQDDYYRDEENIKKDMLGAELQFDKDWYANYLKKNQSN